VHLNPIKKRNAAEKLKIWPTKLAQLMGEFKRINVIPSTLLTTSKFWWSYREKESSFELEV